MLLRRIFEHLKTQNWVAIGLDLIVVVVGIFLAFQVERWYENRRLVAEEGTHLRALADDFAAAREDLEWIIARFEAAAEAGQSLLGLDDDAGAILGNDEFYRMLADAQRNANLEPKRQTYDTLVATGRMGALRDDELKLRLAAYFSEVERLLASRARWDSDLSLIWEPYVNRYLDRVMLIKFAHPDDTGHLRPTHAEDRYLDVIGTDEFEATIAKRWHFYRDRGNNMRELLERTKDMETLLAANLERLESARP